MVRIMRLNFAVLIFSFQRVIALLPPPPSIGSSYVLCEGIRGWGYFREPSILVVEYILLHITLEYPSDLHQTERAIKFENHLKEKSLSETLPESSRYWHSRYFFHFNQFIKFGINCY